MVRIAVLSDVHGNTPALASVLAAVDAEGVDLVLNLGDIASGAVDPRGTLDLLAGLPGIVTVRGNHERQVLTLPRDRMGASDRLADSVLTGADRDWLAALPLTAVPVPGVLAFHASPDDDLGHLTETVTPDGLREATDAEVVERLGAAYGRYALFLCGHTHVARSRRLPDGSLVVNPGSVGWPAFDDDQPHRYRVEAGSPDARYAIVDGEGRGWEARLRSIAYDHGRAADLARANGRPDVAHALLTGRMPVTGS